MSWLLGGASATLAVSIFFLVRLLRSYSSRLNSITDTLFDKVVSLADLEKVKNHLLTSVEYLQNELRRERAASGEQASTIKRLRKVVLDSGDPDAVIDLLNDRLQSISGKDEDGDRDEDGGGGEAGPVHEPSADAGPSPVAEGEPRRVGLTGQDYGLWYSHPDSSTD